MKYLYHRRYFVLLFGIFALSVFLFNFGKIMKNNNHVNISVFVINKKQFLKSFIYFTLMIKLLTYITLTYFHQSSREFIIMNFTKKG